MNKTPGPKSSAFHPDWVGGETLRLLSKGTTEWTRAEADEFHVLSTLQKYRLNVSRTCKHLNIDRKTIYRLLKQWQHESRRRIE